MARAGSGATAITTSRVGKGTESRNRLSGGRGGVEARGAEEELREPRGMTSSSDWGSQGLRFVRSLAGFAEAPRPAPAAAPEREAPGRSPLA